MSIDLTETDVPFRNSEALELAAAITASIASQANLRCLFIKGPPAVAARMRPDRPCADIDVLVHPDDVNLLVEQLAERGWKLRPFVEGMNAPKHSHTAYHPQWPVDLDIHFRFPGLDADPMAAFNALDKSADEYHFAGIPARVPSRAGMLVIQISHALRYWNQEEYTRDLARSDYYFLLEHEWPVSWSELDAILSGTGSWAAMKPFLLQAYPEESKSILFPPPSDDWTSRTSGVFAGKIRATAFMNAPLKDKPKILIRSIYPSREDLASRYLPILEATPWSATKYRIARLIGFARQLPRILRKIARSGWNILE